MEVENPAGCVLRRDASRL